MVAMVEADSLERHRALVKAIERFQDRWRNAWQKAEVKRHRTINLSKIRGWVVNRNGAIAEPFFVGDRDAMLLTPELRRYLSILCFVDSPSDRQIELAKARVQGDIGVSLTRTPRMDIGQPQRRSRTPIPTEPVRQRPVQPNEPANGSVTWAMQRIIRDPSGSVCPAWTPDEETPTDDESRAIDLALPSEQRGSIAKEREKLIQMLARAQAESPLDEWITGQHLRFVLDQDSPARTIATARECRTARVWCLELLGLAFERADSLLAADSVFRLASALRLRAEGASPASCTDTDALMLLPQETRPVVAGMSCSNQQQFTDQLWWLSDPLWSSAGNERYVAHRARQTHIALRSTLGRDERYVWAASGGGAAQRELILRYGWPSYTYWPGGPFEEELSVLRETHARIWTPAPPYAAREYRPDRQAMLPTRTTHQAPWDLTPDQWQTSAPAGVSLDAWWPREHAAISERLATLPNGQDAQWRRDSTILYAIATDDPRTGADRRGFDATLVASTSQSDIRIVAQASVASGTPIRMSAELAPTPQMIGLEARAVPPTTRRSQSESRTAPSSTWYRTRFGIKPPPALHQMSSEVLALSSPVFVSLPEGNDEAPTDPSRVLAQMAGSLTFHNAERVGVYWEAYGFPVGDTVDVRLIVARNDLSNGARRVGERLGVVAERRDSLTIAWREPNQRLSTPIATAVMPTTSRAITLNVRDLAAGSYRLLVEMRRPDGRAARSERVFELRRERGSF